METFGWLIVWATGLGALAYHRISLPITTLAIFIGLSITTIAGGFSWFFLLLAWFLFSGLALLFNYKEFRHKYVVTPIFELFHQSLPSLSKTEREALEAGTLGWEKELFSGNPNWSQLLKVPAPKLTKEEQDFIDGPVTELCERIDRQPDKEVPDPIWHFLKQNGFFGLIIPKEYGGKGFSAYAHSLILTKISTRNGSLGVVVSVPNSLGPAALLELYGTEAQKNYYLPRLATGEEIPCFALTSLQAGSDAASMTDTGVITKGMFEGEEIIGIKLNWSKRYITLAPIATLLGLAFTLSDPDRLLGKKQQLGITCALIPVNTPGVTTGRRHYPLAAPFQNGPTQGEDVFIPLDYIIGGAKMTGQGWRMLMNCLSAGRGISLPSLATGNIEFTAFSTGIYSLVRRQFKLPLCQFEGIQEAIGRIGGFSYLSKATRNFTVNYIDQGEKPAVLSAISKYHITEMARKVITDAMDIHGGKGIMMGPKNYLAHLWINSPIPVTVEGANILTRCLMIFGQGAIRCHPFVLQEMGTVAANDMNGFDALLRQHLSYAFSNAARSLFHGLTFSYFANHPITSSSQSPEIGYYKQLTRASSAFALVTDLCMLLLGGKLKFKESLSAKLGDLLSMMVLGSAVLKHFSDQGNQREDIALLRFSMEHCLSQYWIEMDNLLSNLNNKFVAYGLRALVMPFGRPVKPPLDKLNTDITHILTTKNAARDRLLNDLFISQASDDLTHTLSETFEVTLETIPLRERLMAAVKHKEIPKASIRESIAAALKAFIITPAEAQQLQLAEDLCDKVISVDDFQNIAPKE